MWNGFWFPVSYNRCLFDCWHTNHPTFPRRNPLSLARPPYFPSIPAFKTSFFHFFDLHVISNSSITILPNSLQKILRERRKKLISNFPYRTIQTFSISSTCIIFLVNQFRIQPKTIEGRKTNRFSRCARERREVDDKIYYGDGKEGTSSRPRGGKGDCKVGSSVSVHRLTRSKGLVGGKEVWSEMGVAGILDSRPSTFH